MASRSCVRALCVLSAAGHVTCSLQSGCAALPAPDPPNVPAGFDDQLQLVQLSASRHGRGEADDKHNIVYYLHIPRTSGSSFIWDAQRTLWDLQMASKEGCYDWKDKIAGVGQVAAMVRSPRAHVLSQYLYCSEGPIAWMTKVRGFRKWAQDWVELQARGTVVGDYSAGGHDQIKNQKFVTFTALPFKCYNPANLQCQHFTCNRPFKYPAKVDVDLAIRNMEDTWFVGISEAYQESLCLFHVKLRGILPPFCNCMDKTAWFSFNQTRYARHAARTKASHNVSDFPAEVLQAVDSLTAADRMLYKAAVRRFVQEVHGAEQTFETKILCEDTLQTDRRLGDGLESHFALYLRDAVVELRELKARL
mmetsp:Transcript_1861/g.5629  ORF Transcript_1861/g.5629 Transcript_1861/m.5629 type:complete len:363 (+) Transcript_1861:68-1156(+)